MDKCLERWGTIIPIHWALNINGLPAVAYYLLLKRLFVQKIKNLKCFIEIFACLKGVFQVVGWVLAKSILMPLSDCAKRHHFSSCQDKWINVRKDGVLISIHWALNINCLPAVPYCLLLILPWDEIPHMSERRCIFLFSNVYFHSSSWRFVHPTVSTKMAIH